MTDHRPVGRQRPGIARCLRNAAVDPSTAFAASSRSSESQPVGMRTSVHDVLAATLFRADWRDARTGRFVIEVTSDDGKYVHLDALIIRRAY